MAINKKQTSAITKAVVIFVAAAFILLPMVGVITSLGSGGAPRTQTGSQTATDTAGSIAQRYRGITQSNEEKLSKNASDYPTLVDQGNQYFNWADDVSKASPNSGADQPVWLQSVEYYRRALAVKPGDPAVGTDMAVALYYGGKTNDAISQIEKVMKGSPQFGKGYLNAAVFYRSSNQVPKAIAALERYLQLEPNGENAEQAKSMLTELRGSKP